MFVKLFGGPVCRGGYPWGWGHIRGGGGICEMLKIFSEKRSKSLILI